MLIIFCKQTGRERGGRASPEAGVTPASPNQEEIIFPSRSCAAWCKAADALGVRQDITYEKSHCMKRVMHFQMKQRSNKAIYQISNLVKVTPQKLPPSPAHGGCHPQVGFVRYTARF